MKNKLPLFLLFLVIISGLIISIVPIINGIFPITFDQGRDFLWVKNQVDFKRPSLIGPSGSLVGVFLGPLWFWLLTIPYLLSSGSPLAMTLFNTIIVFASVVVAAVLFYRHNKLVAYFILFLGFTSPAIHSLANFSFNPHLLPLLTILLLYSLIKVYKGSNTHFILSALWLSLMYHAEPPMAVFSLPILPLVIYQSKNKKKLLNFKTIFLSLLAFIIPFLPLIVFDLRHEFIQFKAIKAMFLGQNKSLLEILPLTFWQRIIDRPVKFIQAFQHSIIQNAPNIIIYPLFIAIIYFLKNHLKSGFNKNFFKISLQYLTSLLIIFIFYPYDFKPFYLAGNKLIFIIWGALALSVIWQKNKLRPFTIGFLTLLIFINLNPFDFIFSLKQNFSNRYYLGSLYANQTRVIDWIYQDAAGNGFKAYIFTPPIYDYNFQYLFFWHGLNQYGYLPEEFSYAPNQPEYVPRKQEILQKVSDKIRPASDHIYLIVTLGSKQETADWRTHFKDLSLSLITRHKFEDNTVIEKYKLL